MVMTRLWDVWEIRENKFINSVVEFNDDTKESGLEIYQIIWYS
jgi:hypothetical protein